jgi:hypothetical protein
MEINREGVKLTRGKKYLGAGLIQGFDLATGTGIIRRHK